MTTAKATAGTTAKATAGTAAFSDETMKFLRGLKRNNDREWFEARRDVYERAVRAPQLAVIDAINHAMEAFAPEHVRPANKIAMRIYRDTRFSLNKVPYKTHMAAWWAKRGMEKTSGGGFYLQVGPQEVMVAAGVYMPEREQLLAIRRWMSEHHEAYREAVKKVTKGRLGFDGIDAQQLTRMPKGFAANDPADELVRAKNWGVKANMPVEMATDAGFVGEIVKRMKASAAVVEMLNGAITGGPQDEKRAVSRPIF